MPIITHDFVSAKSDGSDPTELQPSNWNADHAGSILDNFAATTAPAVTDDDGDGYEVGSRWIDTVAGAEYVCVDASTGAAVWVPRTAGGEAAIGYDVLGTYNWPGPLGSGVLIANQAFYVPIVVPVAMTAKKMWYVTGGTTTGAANVDLGIYEPDGTRLVSTGSTAWNQNNNNTYTVVDIADTALAAGLYYFAFVVSATTNVQFLRSDGSSNSMVGLGAYQQASALPLPDPATFAVPTTLALMPLFGIHARSEIT